MIASIVCTAIGTTRIQIRSMHRFLGAVLVLFVSTMIAPGNAVATRINAPGDPALAGAVTQTFDSAAANTFFGSQTFLIAGDGFTVTTVSRELHIDNQFCSSFGTSGNCLDTMNNTNQANDDFDVVFTGFSGGLVSAFGFSLNALDNDWTIETFDVNDVLLSSYLIASQSPGLTGFNRRGYFGATENAPISYFTVRSAGNDRALIDDFSYVAVPEPNAGMLIGLGLLTLAGSRFRDQPTRRHASTSKSWPISFSSD